MSIYINKYRNELKKTVDYGGSLNETTIRKCFIELVNNFAEDKKLVLVEDYGAGLCLLSLIVIMKYNFNSIWTIIYLKY